MSKQQIQTYVDLLSLFSGGCIYQRFPFLRFDQGPYHFIVYACFLCHFEVLIIWSDTFNALINQLRSKADALLLC